MGRVYVCALPGQWRLMYLRGMLDAFIFDLDGTLVDSNAVHVEAWRRAFESHGYRIGPDLIFSQIGKGGDNFVPAVLGKQADEKDGDALRAAQPQEFAALARAQGLEVFPGARELLQTLRERGIKTCLATSSNKKQLELNQEFSHFNVSDFVDEVVNANDIQTSKPAPDLVTAAAKKLKLSPAQCAMVGDTPFDAESAKRAGVVCLAVTCGGHEAATLRASGARAVWQGPTDLLAHLDEVMKIASPGPSRLTQKLLEKLMREALSAAREGMDHGEVPIGATLARGDGSLLARGYNSLNATGNKAAHAEMVTFNSAAGKYPPDVRDLILASTLEPCVMCLGAAMEAAVDTVIFGLHAPADSGTRRVRPPQSPESGMPRIVGGILADESRALFENWLKSGNADNPQQVAFVMQLLAMT